MAGSCQGTASKRAAWPGWEAGLNCRCHLPWEAEAPKELQAANTWIHPTLGSTQYLEALLTTQGNKAVPGRRTRDKVKALLSPTFEPMTLLYQETVESFREELPHVCTPNLQAPTYVPMFFFMPFTTKEGILLLANSVSICSGSHQFVSRPCLLSFPLNRITSISTFQ